ncbi:MAG: hypothetical protein NDJ89_03745 [Oligoflexia bacterium]|nr:hypothetical protein [Oligoflexia bacterium]
MKNTNRARAALLGILLSCVSQSAMAVPEVGVTLGVLDPYPGSISVGVGVAPFDWLEARVMVGYTGADWMNVKLPLTSTVIQPAIRARLPGALISPVLGIGYSVVRTSGYDELAGQSSTTALPVGLIGLDWKILSGLKLGLGGLFALDQGSPRLRDLYASPTFQTFSPYLEIGYWF